MKVGIVTIHRASNYGAALQAFALKEFLKELGHDAKLVDYRCPSIEEMYINMFGNMFSFKSKVKNLLTWSAQKERNKKFSGFIENELECTEDTSCYSIDDLKRCNNQFDVFVSGSDQIWNPFCTGSDKHYFLDFVSDNTKKYSYAASFGAIKKEFLESKEYIGLLDQYQKISVREQKGKEAVKKMTGKEAIVHLDPTFLLSKEKWEEKASEVKIDADKPYVLIYSIAMPESIQQIAEKYASDNNLDIIYITLNNLFSVKMGKKVKTCSPVEFLSYIKNAECVVTNSFHGVAFSIIFNKKFLVEKNANPNHDNSRLENILNCMGLSDRFVENDEIRKDLKDIDYSYVNSKIEDMRTETINYFKEIESDKKQII